MIKVTDLRVDFDSTCAVRDLSFEIGESVCFGLIGPNGAGKTTTMRSIIGLIEPTYGEITVDDIDVIEYPEEGAKLIGFMPDNPPLYDDLLVWEFLDLFAASYFIPKFERRDVIGEYLNMVGLWEKRDASIPELSRGMRQRLMLAKTLIPDPKFLILDEPASGVDPHGRADLKEIIKDVVKRGKSVLISSHILSEMNEFCTAIGIMERGRMVVSGDVDSIREKMGDKAVLRLEVLGKEDALYSTLERNNLVHKVQAVNQRVFQFQFTGDDKDVAELLRQIISAGIPVVSFIQKKADLEELFLRIGARDLS